MKKFLLNTRLIIVIALLARVFGMLATDDPMSSFHRMAENKWKDQFNVIMRVNNDELLIAEVALSHHYGLSYASRHEAKRAGYVYDFTAYRPSYPVYIHILFQEIYFKLFPQNKLELLSTDPYFIAYAFLLHGISIMLFFISLFFFRMTAGYLLDDKWAGLATLLYGLHPAVMMYVGNLANYESIVTSLLIIAVALLLKACTEKLSPREYVIVIISFIVSIVLRPQLNFIYFFLFTLFLVITFLKRKAEGPVFVQSIKLVGACSLIFLISLMPVLVKNYRLFGGWTLGTNGFVFNFGHNPYALGSWCGTCATDSSSDYYKYIREQISGIDTLDEYQKSVKTGKLTMDWIRQNPVAETKLLFRKVAIYFLPYNSDHNVFNPLNLIFHLGTGCFVLLVFYELLIKRKFSVNRWLLMGPLAGSLAISIVFFVGYRWRYYAEPYMVLMTLLVVHQFIGQMKAKKSPAK